MRRRRENQPETPAGARDRICLSRDCDLELGGKRSRQLWWRHSGAGLAVSPGSQRLSSSKGQTTRECGTQRDRPDDFFHEVAALPKGRTTGEPTVHPATYGDTMPHEVVLIRGRVYPRYVKACPAFIFFPQQKRYTRRINLFMRSIARAPHSEDGKFQGLDLNQQLTGSEPVVLPIELPWKKSVAEAGLEPARPHGTPGSEPGASAIPPLGPFVSPTTLGGI
jgi:hypothetical protein